ncbi:hypothetical protein Tco_0191494 [Tanacetum coccineum]
MLTFNTVKCIPHGCRLAFSQALKTVLCKVVAQPDSVDAWVMSLLFPRCTLQLARRCPPILAEFVASTPLTPLFKPHNEIQPIAVGTIWRRLVSKLAMKGLGKEMSKYLSDFQYVVGLSGGIEVVLHSGNSVLSEYHNDESLVMLNVDFSNAFNLVDRSASLHEAVIRCEASWGSVSRDAYFISGLANEEEP